MSEGTPPYRQPAPVRPWLAPALMGHAPSGRRAGSPPPDDAQVNKVFADCALKQNRQQMRTALQKSDWQAALSYANQILALEPGDDDAQKAVRDCTLAVSRQSVH